MKRESMVIYESWFKGIRNLPRDQRGDVLTAIIEYGLYGSTSEGLKPVTSAFLEFVKPIIEANNVKYENGCKGAEFGHLGGRPKKQNEGEEETPTKPLNNPKLTPKKPQENPNKTPNVNVNVNVSKEKEKSYKKETERENAVSFSSEPETNRTSSELKQILENYVCEFGEEACGALASWLTLPDTQQPTKSRYEVLKRGRGGVNFRRLLAKFNKECTAKVGTKVATISEEEFKAQRLQQALEYFHKAKEEGVSGEDLWQLKNKLEHAYMVAFAIGD